jgi:hypothetical protein
LVFNSVEDLIKVIENETKKAMEYTAREMQKRIRVLILEEIYSTHPEKYERLYEILNSVEVVPLQKKGNEWIIEVRFKNTPHTNKSWYNAEGAGIHVGDTVTLSQIMEAIAEGEAKMGTYGTEIDIMGMANEEFIVANKAFRMIFDYLKDNFQMTWVQ